MSMSKEQHTRKYFRPGRGLLRYLKRAYAKWRRQRERLDIENAPTRNIYHGWID